MNPELEIARLADKLYGEDADTWYFAPDQRLGGKCPREAIEEGGVAMAAVLLHLEQIATGAYA